MEPTYSIVVYPGRELPEAYKPLIFSKWLRSLRYGNDLFKMIESKAYYEAYHRFIENILIQPVAVVRLAVLTEDSDVVLGFSVYRDHILDYVHVHKDMRNQGIAFHLTPKRITHFTHITNMGEFLWRRRHKEWVFNPFA